MQGIELEVNMKVRNDDEAKHVPEPVQLLIANLNTAITLSGVRPVNVDDEFMLDKMYEFQFLKMRKCMTQKGFYILTTEDVILHFNGPFKSSRYFQKKPLYFSFFSDIKYQLKSDAYVRKNQMSPEEMKNYYLRYVEMIKACQAGTCLEFSILALSFAEIYLKKKQADSSLIVEHVMFDNWVHNLIRIKYKNSKNHIMEFFYDPWFQFHPYFSETVKNSHTVILPSQLEGYMRLLTDSLSESGSAHAKIIHRERKFDPRKKCNIRNTDRSFSCHALFGTTYEIPWLVETEENMPENTAFFECTVM